MPCFCWIDDSEIEPEMKIIREHAREIVRQAKIIHGKGDLYPKVGDGPCPRSPILDVHTLLDDLWNGRCSEAGKGVE
jgi:hypothetical protein